MILPPDAKPLIWALFPFLTTPTLNRLLTLLAAAILTPGRRTVANLLRTLGTLAPGHRTSYQRVFSSASWSGLQLGCALARLVLDRFGPDGPVTLVGDDTVDGHPGRQVYGKARHRDAVRSSHSYTAWRYGHKWVVLAVLVTFPFTTRRWALPVLVDLYRSPELDEQEHRPHKTPAQLLCRLLRLLLLRFPDRTFVLACDSGFGTHAVTRFCHRHRERLTLVSKLCPDANLFDPPPAYTGHGRPRIKGPRRPKPREVAATASRRQLKVAWYGGGTRRVEIVTDTGHWYKAGQGLVPIRWVFVHDVTGTHRDEYLFTTDTTFTPENVVAAYCGRWNIETTFQECRSELGLETTRGWCRRTVLRAAPCLFGLYTVVAVLYTLCPEAKRMGGIVWPGKTTVTFSDARHVVGRWIWEEGLFRQLDPDGCVAKLPPTIRELLLNALTSAA